MRYHALWVRILWLASLSLALASCQPQNAPTLTILDGEQIHVLASDERIPANLLAKAGVTLAPGDQVLENGLPLPLESPLPAGFQTLQIRRAATVTLATPDGEQSLSATADTVGGALYAAGIQLYAADFVDPPVDSPLSAGMTITYRPSQELTVTTSGGIVTIRSSARMVGAALAGAGIPLIGLDYSLPAESEAPPADGQVRVVRVSETVQLVQKPIPFETETVSSPEVELGQQEILQPGQEGLAIARTRIRYEDGQEVSRTVEEESVVRPPQKRIVQTGTQVVINTTTLGGVTLEYWRAFEMYATIYSPCNSGTGGCSYGTASGMRAGRGVVAVDPSMYSYLGGQRVYIPGYGYGVIGDIGGGYIVEDSIGVSRYRWIDLGFDDNNIVDMRGWLTVYFLAPAPASIPPVMQ
ncbi:MAG: G5 domain-containing protein [Anaerolineales bacterium]|nr:G5 domain-containing protein [Anaerolineales bacterium]